MKRIFAFLLSAIIMLSLTACGKDDDMDMDIIPDDNDNSTTENLDDDLKPVDALQRIWDNYAESDRFTVGGGDSVDNATGGAAVFNHENTAELEATLGISGDLAKEITSAASLMHMLNANTFTSAAFKLKDDADERAFAKQYQKDIDKRRWLDGFPDKVIVMEVEDDIVVTAFGKNDAIALFKQNAQKTFPDADILVETDIAT